MPSPLSRFTRRTVRATQNIVSQIVVSVAAAVCVAFITSAYLDEGPAAAVVEPETVAAEVAAPASKDPAAAPSARLAGASLPPLDHEIVTDLPIRDVRAAYPGAEIFPGVPATAPAEALGIPDPAEEKRERRRFLGLPLPYFVADGW